MDEIKLFSSISIAKVEDATTSYPAARDFLELCTRSKERRKRPVDICGTVIGVERSVSVFGRLFPMQSHSAIMIPQPAGASFWLVLDSAWV